jgi:hypothetical protein
MPRLPSSATMRRARLALGELDTRAVQHASRFGQLRRDVAVRLEPRDQLTVIVPFMLEWILQW